MSLNSPFASTFAIGSMLVMLGLARPSLAQTSVPANAKDQLVYVVNSGTGTANTLHKSIAAYMVGSNSALVRISDPGPAGSSAAGSEETGRSIAGGGISVPGWEGKIDSGAEKQGQTVKDAKLAPEGSGFRITTGPAVIYWNPQNLAKGDYTVSATFTEPKFMNLNTHPHPYGIFIGGNDLGSAQESLLYCAAYGNGTFIVRGFGPDAFQMGGRRPEENDAVHKAAGVGQLVSQEIAMSVKGDKVMCSINGTVVATYDKSAVVVPGKLKSTDGVYGIRFAHNTEAIVTDLKMTRP